MNIRNELGKLRNEVWHILQMDYSKRTSFIPSILGRIDGILDIPKRNCDVGTAEEQVARQRKWCVAKRDFSCDSTMCRKCFADWGQMPYEEGKNNE